MLEQLFVTLQEEPSDAEVRSHALMARAGFLLKLSAGIYVYGPMLWRVLQKIEAIVRRESGGRRVMTRCTSKARPLRPST